MIAHDPSLVVLSITIAILGTFTASVMTSNVNLLPPKEGRMRIVMAAVALGGSIWAMNFVGLLSIEVPINLAYNPLPLALSALTAFIGTAAALFMLWPERPGASPLLPAAIFILGIAIAATSFLGIGAVAGRGVEFSWFLASVSAAFAIQAAMVLLVFLFRPRGVVLTLLGAVVLGLLLTATHYLAIASAPALEDTLLGVPPGNSGISEHYLAWAATIMTYVICCIGLSTFVIVQFRGEIE